MEDGGQTEHNDPPNPFFDCLESKNHTDSHSTVLAIAPMISSSTNMHSKNAAAQRSARVAAGCKLAGAGVVLLAAASLFGAARRALKRGRKPAQNNHSPLQRGLQHHQQAQVRL